ncbi:MAG: hypothetical protein LBD62_05610 [Candidatus Margulisbacteria bacterium]|jgi:hypothetical protein|nr:hypothetical protein [Candidatus Margulisiibacteriota bacterium]
MVDIKELEEKSRSRYGKYTPAPTPPLMAFLSKYVFKKHTPGRSFLNGFITAAVLLYAWFSKNYLPLTLWLIFDVSLTVAAIFYWRAEQKRLNKEMERIGQEVQGIQAEILERKQYFDNIRAELAKASRN